MTKRMLIDAAHAEETRVVVIDGQRIEELDFESLSRKQLRGNIYLAKVTRVEPSLQAAFIEYGGNRHGFLAFNEIHPDYYQIPHADRETLMREEAEEEAKHAGDDETDEEAMDEAMERRRRRLMRRYKIQEVIKRRQIMLVQVVKEERGNKGAALTTYLSLAGRYCVLMPNTARGGGISRKITSATDRKRLKSAVQSLEVPKGMGLIIRTAGAARTKVEIKRDYEYLLRLWENIREKTMQSIAPALIYEEEDLVKRAIRDMFDKDLDSIQVEGEAGYKEARDFMRMIMPSQAKKVVHYREPTPLFVRHRIEDQIAQIHTPVVQLKSGGYLVINQTEALVAIDVNSGRATKERNIETTALKTNLEAAEEAARQMRLRDLAGLIVIDFIDMDEGKNNRAVEKVLKDALKDDRARIQMGKISGFGLMEISRQRRRTGVLEGSTHVCEHCQGTGRVRSVESSAVATLRAIEMESVNGGAGAITVRMPTAVGLYILNEKRAYLANLDSRYDLHVSILIDDKLAAAEFEIERTESREGPPRELVQAEPEPEWTPPEDMEDDEIEADEDEAEVEARGDDESEDGGEGRQGRGRRRRRRGGRREEGFERPAQDAVAGEESEDEEEDGEGEGEEDRHASDEGSRRRRRRRGRRGGRRLREEGGSDDVYAWRDPHAERRPTDETARQEGRNERQGENRGEGRGENRGENRGERQRDVYAWRDPHAPADREERPQGRPEGRYEDERGPRRGRNRRRGRGRGEGGFEGGASAPVAAAEAREPDAYGWEPQAEAEAPQAVTAEAPQSAGNDNPTPIEPPAVDAPIAATPSRRPRRGRGAAALAEAVPAEAAEAVAAVVETSAPIAPPEPEATAEPQPEPVAAEPAAPPEPDPNEISTPPATPRRGWWRRLI